jgi:hypothetical protein
MATLPFLVLYCYPEAIMTSTIQVSNYFCVSKAEFYFSVNIIGRDMNMVLVYIKVCIR